MNKKLLLTIALVTGTAAQAAQPLSNGVKAALVAAASAVSAGVYTSVAQTVKVAPTTVTTTVTNTLKDATEQVQSSSTGTQIALRAAALCAGLYATYKAAQWIWHNAGSKLTIDNYNNYPNSVELDQSIHPTTQNTYYTVYRERTDDLLCMVKNRQTRKLQELSLNQAQRAQILQSIKNIGTPNNIYPPKLLMSFFEQQ